MPTGILFHFEMKNFSPIGLPLSIQNVLAAEFIGNISHLYFPIISQAKFKVNIVILKL